MSRLDPFPDREPRSPFAWIFFALLLGACMFAWIQICGCIGDNRTPAPDAPLPICAELGCAYVLCSSYESSVCSCNGQACEAKPGSQEGH